MDQTEMIMNDPIREPYITEQIECVKRELKYRNKVYGYRVLNGKMSQREMDKEIWLMTGVLNTLLELPKEKKIVLQRGVPD